MKRVVLIIALLLCLSACAKPAAQTPNAIDNQKPVTQMAAPKTHPCGAITKSGKPCTRKVSNGNYTDAAVEARCWQHK